MEQQELSKSWPREWTQELNFDFEDIIYEKKYVDQGGIGKITINRPQRLNAVTKNSMKEISLALMDISHDKTIGVGIFTGSGERAFCTGGDVEWEGKGGLQSQMIDYISLNRQIRLCRKPVIAAVKGYAIGGGNHWAYFCDLTIAAENAVFGQTGPRVASPADGYIVSYLSRVVGAKKAREIWMLCRQYTAHEALAMGLVNKVVPLEELDNEVEKWCQEILGLSPTCIEVIKRSFDAEDDHLLHSCHWWHEIMYPNFFESEEYKEGPKAFKEKRPPNWAPSRRPKNNNEV
jgi:naphthoate synthase